MNAPVKGLALGVSPEGPEDEVYAVGDRVVWFNVLGYEYHATVSEVWDDCLEIELDIPLHNVWKAQDIEAWGRTRIVHANELRPIDTPGSH